jgi:hypothetical protein
MMFINVGSVHRYDLIMLFPKVRFVRATTAYLLTSLQNAEVDAEWIACST